MNKIKHVEFWITTDGKRFNNPSEASKWQSIIDNQPDNTPLFYSDL